MKDNAMKELPEGMPAPKSGWAYVGKGPLKVQAQNRHQRLDIAACDPGLWEYGDFSGSGQYHYAVRIGTEIARLNGIPDDYGQPKQAQPTHNWIARADRKPTDEDYPIWFQSGERVYLARRAYSTYRGIPLGLGSSQPQDRTYTHWQQAIVPEPIRIEPEPSVMERLLLEEDIRKAEEALAAMRKKLGGAQ